MNLLNILDTELVISITDYGVDAQKKFLQLRQIHHNQ